MDARWAEETAAILSGFREWRQAHPQATLGEIEAARDVRGAGARARLGAAAALASAAGGLRALPPEARPRRPDCGATLEARGREVRHLPTTREPPVALPRHRAGRPACGTGPSPPG